MKTCAKHRKKCYPTQAAAFSAALRYSRKRGTALRAYRQPGCGWHLTKKARWEVAA